MAAGDEGWFIFSSSEMKYFIHFLLWLHFWFVSFCGDIRHPKYPYKCRVIWTCKLNKCTFYCCILNGVISCGGTVLSMCKLFTSAPEDVFCRSLAVTCIRLIEILLCALLLISTANYNYMLIMCCIFFFFFKEHFLISNFKDSRFTMHSVKMFSWDTFIVQSDHFSHIQSKESFPERKNWSYAIYRQPNRFPVVRLFGWFFWGQYDTNSTIVDTEPDIEHFWAGRGIMHCLFTQYECLSWHGRYKLQSILTFVILDKCFLCVLFTCRQAYQCPSPPEAFPFCAINHADDQNERLTKCIIRSLKHKWKAKVPATLYCPYYPAVSL